jgi:hypothetical protein
MAKELPFFKFEISEWMLGRIQKQPLSIQGAFINLCCKYWHKLGELTTVDARLDFDNECIDALLSKGIIGTDGEYIYIKFLDKQLDECQELSKKNSINGLKSAKIRADRKRALTTVEPSLPVVQRVSTEEKRKEEKRVREEEITTPSKAFGITTDQFIIIKGKYIGEPAIRVNGKDGLKEYYESNKSVLQFPEHSDKFLRKYSGGQFNEFMHVFNTFNKFVEGQYK